MSRKSPGPPTSMDSSDPPPNSKDPSGTVKRPAKAASVGNQLKRASVVRSDNAAGGSSGRDSIPGHSSRRARSSSRTAAGRRSGDNGTTADKVSFEAALRRLQELQPRSLPPAIPPSTPSTRRRSSSMPEPESVGLLLAPRPCYSASVSGTCTPTDYASSPSGPRSTGRELQPIKSTLSYLDLAASRATGENAAPPGVPELPESPSGSVTALVARTWAHDMSADARRNRTPSPGTDAATSGNTPSGLPTAYCTPAKVAIVVKLELMTDQPVTLRPLASTEHTSSGLLETSAFERAAARKQNRVSKKSQRFAGAISNATSEAVGCHSRPPASSSSSSSADGSSSKEPQGAPK